MSDTDDIEIGPAVHTPEPFVQTVEEFLQEADYAAAHCNIRAYARLFAGLARVIREKLKSEPVDDRLAAAQADSVRWNHEYHAMKEERDAVRAALDDLRISFEITGQRHKDYVEAARRIAEGLGCDLANHQPTTALANRIIALEDECRGLRKQFPTL